MIHRAAVVILLLTIPQRSKFSSWSQIKQKNLIQSNGLTFSTTIKLNILVVFPRVGQLLHFATPRRSERSEKCLIQIPASGNSTEVLDETTSCLREHVHGMKVELVLNLGEVGRSE
jgi:hypothetical protein